MNEDAEIVDIVDKYDHPTGKVIDREEAHKRIVPHRVSAVLVFRSNGRLIVQVHAWHGRRLDRSVGGHVSSGESYEVAAKREMQEELGIDMSIERVAEGVLSEEYYPKDNNRAVHLFGVFKAETSAEWQFKETEEIDMLVEMEIAEVVDMMNSQPDRFLQGFTTSLAAYLRYINSPKKIKAYDREWGLV